MAKLENRNTFLSPIGQRVISPGVNIIPDAELEILKENSFFKSQVKLGKWIVESTGVAVVFEGKEEVVPPTTEATHERAVIEIKAMDTKAAAAMIVGSDDKPGILDLALLQAIKEGDARRGVQRAVDAQIDFLTSDPEPKE